MSGGNGVGVRWGTWECRGVDYIGLCCGTRWGIENLKVGVELWERKGKAVSVFSQDHFALRLPCTSHSSCPCFLYSLLCFAVFHPSLPQSTPFHPHMKTASQPHNRQTHRQTHELVTLSLAKFSDADSLFLSPFFFRLPPPATKFNLRLMSSVCWFNIELARREFPLSGVLLLPRSFPSSLPHHFITEM